MKKNIYTAFFIVVIAFLTAFGYIYKINSTTLNYSLMSLPTVHYSSLRGPASISSKVKEAVSSHQARLAVIPQSNNPPIISPDNPIQPRKSSGQSGDPAWINIFSPFNLNKINQPTIPEALCNDGTQPSYYLKRGFGAGANRWIIWLEGGGGCGSDDPTNPTWCGYRKNTYLSTSNGLPSSVGDMQGILTKSDAYNSDFYSYNQISVHYCSSDFWGGTGVKKVIDSTTQEKWWFSGRKIVEALVLDLKQKYNFANATNVILTGSSAGGAGIVMNADEIKNSIPNADVVTLVDAVNIIPFYRYFKATNPEPEYIDEPIVFKNIYEWVPMIANKNCLNSQRKCGINERCIREDYKCMLPGVASRYLKMPTFIAADQLDNSILAMYSLSLCTERNKAEYGPWLNEFTAQSNAAAKTVSGYFLPRTGDHGLAPTHHWVTPVVENGVNVRLKDVFGAWYFNRSTSVKKFIQTPSTTLDPHQESSQGLCSQ
jgi:hypothetical protein